MRANSLAVSSFLALTSLSHLNAAAEATHASNELRVCNDVREPASLDPLQAFSEKSYVILQQIHESLIRFTSDGRMEPALASSWTRTNDTTFRFFLRKDVRFHNGGSFDARAVEYNVRKYLDPKTDFPGRWFLGPLERAAVIDRHTVDLVTSVPDSIFLNRIAAFLYIVAPDYYSKENGAFGRAPIGTGPFKFERWTAGREISIARNDSYWEGGLPRLDRLTFKFMAVEEQVESFLKGNVDVLMNMPGTQTKTVIDSGMARVTKKHVFMTIGATFNNRTGPLKDKRVRQALNYATDRADLIRYDQLGNAAVIASLAMPGAPGFDPALKPYPYDPNKAKQLLAEAGFNGRVRLRALVQSEDQHTASILRRQWERVGIDLDIRWTNDIELLDDIKSFQPDLALGGCPDPMVHSFFIASIFIYSKSPYSLTHDPEFDSALEAAVAEIDPAKSEEAIRGVNRLIHRESLSLFTYQKIKTYAIRRGVSFNPSVTGMPHFFTAEISAK